MKDELQAFEAAIARLMSAFDSVPESLTPVKPRPEDWSVKETRIREVRTLARP